MTPPSEGSLAGKANRRGKAGPYLLALWPRAVELWIATVLVTFFVVRVLGSGTGQRILSHFRGMH
jgi:hypothetical protein